MKMYEVRCITVMEEIYEVYADSEYEAKGIIDLVLEDPDKTLIEQQVIEKSNYRVKEIDDSECNHDFEAVAFNTDLADGTELYDCICRKCGEHSILNVKEKL